MARSRVRKRVCDHCDDEHNLRAGLGNGRSRGSTCIATGGLSEVGAPDFISGLCAVGFAPGDVIGGVDDAAQAARPRRRMAQRLGATRR
jgi:hypothetical protein